uniref:Uncharacterized protein n=1 Tax=Pararge aegeria TaxID=116150 RepID=S4PSZ2_9NEOP
MCLCCIIDKYIHTTYIFDGRLLIIMLYHKRIRFTRESSSPAVIDRFPHVMRPLITQQLYHICCIRKQNVKQQGLYSIAVYNSFW